MVMFQYSVCDKHLGVVKLNGFLTMFLKMINRMFCCCCFFVCVCVFILTCVKPAYSAMKKDLNKVALSLTVFQRDENNFRGNMKPCR